MSWRRTLNVAHIFALVRIGRHTLYLASSGFIRVRRWCLFCPGWAYFQKIVKFRVDIWFLSVFFSSKKIAFLSLPFMSPIFVITGCSWCSQKFCGVAEVGVEAKNVNLASRESSVGESVKACLFTFSYTVSSQKIISCLFIDHDLLWNAVGF